MTIKGKQRHNSYAKIPHILDDEHTYSSNLTILIMVINVVVYARMGLIIPMFTLVTIITYGLKTLI